MCAGNLLRIIEGIDFEGEPLIGARRIRETFHKTGGNALGRLAVDPGRMTPKDPGLKR